MDLFESQRKDPFHRADSLDDLCSLADADFVNCAFVTLLGRQADPEGMQHYLRHLRRGTAKLTIIRALRRSGEGQRHDPGIAGLDRRLRRHAQANLPVIGRLVRVFTGDEGNSAADRRRRAAENEAQLQQALETRRFATMHHHAATTLARLDALTDLTRAALRNRATPGQRLAEAEDTGRDSWQTTLARAFEG